MRLTGTLQVQHLVEPYDDDVLEIYYAPDEYCLSGTRPPRWIKRGTLRDLQRFVERSGLYLVRGGTGDGLAFKVDEEFDE